jgi:hypothetical protein
MVSLRRREERRPNGSSFSSLGENQRATNPQTLTLHHGNRDAYKEILTVGFSFEIWYKRLL